MNTINIGFVVVFLFIILISIIESKTQKSCYKSDTGKEMRDLKKQFEHNKNHNRTYTFN